MGGGGGGRRRGGGGGGGARKKPYSGKAKKEQLRLKRDEKKQRLEREEAQENVVEIKFQKSLLKEEQHHEENKEKEKEQKEHNSTFTTEEYCKDGKDKVDLNIKVDKLHFLEFDSDNKSVSQRFRLHFIKEPQTAIDERKRKARLPFQMLSEENLEVGFEDVYGKGKHFLAIPTRPEWDYSMSKETVEKNEQIAFKKWVEDVIEKNQKQLAFFELNLETWRQLWRVIEISDIILLIADIRHPLFHFPPSLYNYVTKILNKPMVMILNKVDLVSEKTRIAWKLYFEETFPELHVALFTSYPHDQSKVKDLEEHFRKKRGRMKKHKLMAWGADQILEACEDCVIQKTSDSANADAIHQTFGTWNRKLENMEEYRMEQERLHYEEDDDAYTTSRGAQKKTQHQDFDSDSEDEVEALHTELASDRTESDNKSLVTIGVVGSPNVGKSTLLNGLVGKKVVSTSRTPGHTKHFQTIYLTTNIRLCDSPGIVFPSLVEKSLQILAGIYPISQVREPYSPVQYLAERIPLVDILKVEWPYDEDEHETINRKQDSDGNLEWSAWAICDAWAKKRGYFTAKAGHLDTYRAANSILRLAVDGRLVLSAKPPGFYNGDYTKDRKRKNTEILTDTDGEDDVDPENKIKHESKIRSHANPFSLLMNG